MKITNHSLLATLLIFAFLLPEASGFQIVGSQDTVSASGKALINADYVRVRSGPDKGSAELGYIFKNMVAEITGRSSGKASLGNESHYWYEVKSGELHGWVFGKYLNTNATSLNVNTYDAPGDTQWLVNRFGDSTWFHNQQLSINSFTMDDYRNLMRAAENGSELSWSALRMTILAHLHDNPDDPLYAYLKTRLYSPEFLKSIISHLYAYNDINFFSLVPYSRDIVLEALKMPGYLARSLPETMPAEYWKDKEIAVLALQYSCNSASEEKVKSLLGDPGINAALERCGLGASKRPAKQPARKIRAGNSQ